MHGARPCTSATRRGTRTDTGAGAVNTSAVAGRCAARVRVEADGETPTKGNLPCWSPPTVSSSAPQATNSPTTAVLIRGDTITAVGPRDEIERQTPADAPRLHHPSGTLLPGLIDSHVHTVFDAGPDASPPATATTSSPSKATRSPTSPHWGTYAPSSPAAPTTSPTRRPLGDSHRSPTNRGPRLRSIPR